LLQQVHNRDGWMLVVRSGHICNLVWVAAPEISTTFTASANDQCVLFAKIADAEDAVSVNRKMCALLPVLSTAAGSSSSTWNLVHPDLVPPENEQGQCIFVYHSGPMGPQVKPNQGRKGHQPNSQTVPSCVLASRSGHRVFSCEYVIYTMTNCRRCTTHKTTTNNFSSIKIALLLQQRVTSSLFAVSSHSSHRTYHSVVSTSSSPAASSM
jgi:hypothetical protein